MDRLTGLTDSHLHSILSMDGTATCFDYCRAAIDRGLTHLTFTEHVDFDPSDEACGFYDYDRQRTVVAAARRRFGDRLDIGMGVEITVDDHYLRRQEGFLAGKEFDLIIGSVHYLDGFLPIEAACFRRLPPPEVFRRYYEGVARIVREADVDAIGHIDWPKRGALAAGVTPPDHEQFYPLLRRILTEAVARGIVLEVNSAGLRHGCCDPYPHTDLLRLYRDCGGGPISMGSDSHHLDHFGYGMDQVARTLARVGFDRVVVFRRRRPQPVPLPAWAMPSAGPPER